MKCRVRAQKKGGAQTFSVFRSMDFDSCVFLLLHPETYELVAARELDRDVVTTLGRVSSHVNGRLVRVAQAFDEAVPGTDVTDRLRSAMAYLDDLPPRQA